MQIERTNEMLVAYLEEVGVAESGAQAEYEIPLGMLGDRLHNGAIDDDQMLGRCLNMAPFPRVARVEEQGGSFQADPVATPASLRSQLDLMFLAEQPFLDAQESVLMAGDRWFRLVQQ